MYTKYKKKVPDARWLIDKSESYCFALLDNFFLSEQRKFMFVNNITD